MQSVGEQLGKSNLEVFRSHPSLVTSDAIGVELELEGWTSGALDEAGRALHPLWQVTSDGSLRNGGAEFITQGGLGGESLHQAFERMCALLSRVNYDASWRCSTHMHINMLDFTVNQVARFLMVYAACEPVLFKHCGQFRRSSNFCTPVGDSLPFHKKLIARLWDDVVATRAARESTNKYTALNLQPLFGNDRQRALGTVEFRGGKPMTQLNEFILQANLLLSIKQFVRSFEGNEEQMLIRLNDGVFNTVYSNGCAASLEVPSEELDDALIHAWLLLKAYQIGMTKKPEKKVGYAFDEMPVATASVFAGWDAQRATAPSNTPPVPTAAQLDRYGWYTPHLRPSAGADQNAVFTSRERAPKLHRYMEQLVDQQLSEIERDQYIAVSLMDRALGVMQSSGDDVSKFQLGYHLQVADNYLCPPDRQTISPVAAIQRQMEARALGIKPCIIEHLPPSQQPVLTINSLNVDYRAACGTVSRWTGLMARLGLIERSGNKGLFNTLVNTRVRIRFNGARSVNAILTSLGAVTGIHNGEVQAVYAKYLIKLSNINSELVIHPEDLPTYDKVCAVVDELQSLGCAVPVFKPRHTGSNAPNGVLRLEVSPLSGVGIGIPARVASEPATMTPRVSATTGLNVY